VKILWMTLLMVVSLSPSLAQDARFELSVIKSIDDYELPLARSHASPKALPEDYSNEVVKTLNSFQTAIISEGRAKNLFNQLTKNPKARMKIAGGKCSYRRSYIQSYLRRLNIDSGRLLINCPAKNGRLRMKDQVTGRRYTFSNFHDTNVVSIRTASGVGLRVMDVQFESAPVSLSRYLAKIEASQKIKPLRNRRESDKGFCYWTLN
jgi:hypothetical protein